VTITGGTALDSDAIDQMVKDAEAHAADDAERREAAETRNSADHAVYTVGKQLAEHGEALSDDEKASIQTNLDALKTTLEDENASVESLKEGTNTLMESAQIIGQKMYEAAQAEAAAAAPEDAAPTGDDDDDVVEAEVVEEDEE
ncbi:MAG: Hsp70 family protein, partial [Actinomycetota bacterium]